MEFDHVRRAAHIPNLTPLIDIVLLLLVFFMLTAHFVRDEAINIDLPEAASAEKYDEDEVVRVVVDKEGAVVLNGEAVDMASLEQKIAAALESRRNKAVQIRGDSGSNLGLTVSILDAARKAGASGADIVTEQP